MAQVINTNSLSLITQNNINKNQSALSSSIERLSSGLRINSAKDDAAGQAIANRFTSNIKGLTQAARNANDGISVAQTTEGALSEINNNLQRVRELTVQAQNGTNSKSDLSSIQDEIKSRLEEIDRVSGQTQFNGVSVLAKDGSMKIQVGANDNETITIDLQHIDAKTLGLDGFNVNNHPNISIKNATVGVDTTTYDETGATILSTAAGTAGTKLNTLDANGTIEAASIKFDQSTGKYYGSVQNTTGKNGIYEVTVDKTTGKVDLAGTTPAVISAGIPATATISPTKAEVATTTTVQKPIDSSVIAGSAAANTLKAAGIDTTDLALVQIHSTDSAGNETGAATYGLQTKDGTIYATDFDPASYDPAATPPTAINAKTVSYTDANGKSQTGVMYLGGDTGKKGLVTVGTGSDAKTYDAKALQGADLSALNALKPIADNSNPLKALDAAIASVDKFRSSLGAVQNRLDSAITNLNNTTTNLSEAQSRIQDADYATEVSNMSKAQIIQQAGNSVLAKANQVPQQVLSLLQG